MDIRRFLSIYSSVPAVYYDWIFEIIRPHLAAPLLEAGPGPGLMTRRFLSAGFMVTAVEPQADIRAYLQRELGGGAAFRLLDVDIEKDRLCDLPGAPFASAVCLNVLEHVQDDHAAVLNMVGALKPGGVLAVMVPAWPCLYGSMDAAFGHLRRYRKHELESLLRCAGLQYHVKWFNFLGYFGWWWRFRLRKKQDFGLWSNRVFGVVAPLMKSLESCFGAPLGLSLICVGRKASSGLVV